MTSTTAYRLAWALALVTTLFLVWALGALGLIGDGGKPDRVYLSVLAIGVGGAAAARLRADRMALVLRAMAAAHVAIAAFVLLTGLHEAEGASALDVLGLNGMYAALFGAAAWLFRQAARGRSASRESAPVGTR